MKRSPIGIDLFCGAGGMSLGFEQAGFDIIAGFDSEPINVKAYSQNFPSGKAILADLSRVSGEEVRRLCGLRKREKIAVVFGGPPCQGFSLIGKRKLDDARNLLVYHFARLVEEMEPAYFVLENVAGLVLGKARKVVTAFIRRVHKAGYSVREPVQVLCASNYWVPQRRERVFILGGRKGLALPEYPAGCTSNSSAWGEHKPTVWDAVGDLPNVDTIPCLAHNDVLKRKLGKPSPYAAVLRSEVVDPEDLSQSRDINGRGLSGCMRTFHSRKTVKRFAATAPGSYEPVSRFHRLVKHGIANTLRAGTGPSHGSHTAARPIHPSHPRCITVREAARLQTFPDWFQFDKTKWHGFRQVGNAVPPLFARAVATAILQALAKKVAKK